MSGKVKVAGSWKDVAPHVKISSAWRLSKSGWVKVAGVWQGWFFRGGTDDSTFTLYDQFPRALTSGTNAVAIQPDGKTVVAGLFATWNGRSSLRVTRLNVNGSVDTDFAAKMPTNVGPTSPVMTPNAIVIQPDGKILIASNFYNWFTSYTGGATVPYAQLIRLNSDGSVDTAFSTNLGTTTGSGFAVNAIGLQPDGKIVIGGTFTVWNGTTVNRIVRLNSDGTRDTTFTTNVGTAANNTINAIAVQSDGKILVGGAFTTWNSVAGVSYIVRLNSDGTRDTAFTTNTGGPTSTVRAIVMQPDGKILVGGSWSTTWGSYYSPRFVRLESSGIVDAAFNTNSSGFPGASGGVFSIALQSTGDIVLGGSVSGYQLARYNSSGVLDTAFATRAGLPPSTILSVVVQSDDRILVATQASSWTTGGVTRQINCFVRLAADGTFSVTPSAMDGAAQYSALPVSVNAIATQGDGKILVGGGFTTWNGVSANRIVRLAIDGTIDTAFMSNIGTGADNSILAFAIQSDGKILVCGSFTTWNGVAVARMVRLNADGTRDTGFVSQIGNGSILCVVIQTDGNILIGGTFTSTVTPAGTVGCVTRISSSGSIDVTFNANVGSGASTQATVSTLALQPDGKILVGGAFTSWSGTASIGRIVRLNSTGTRDTAFTTAVGTAVTSGSISALAIQSDGKILVGGNFTTWSSATVGRILRLNSDATRDTAFSTNNGSGASGTINAISLQSDGKIVIGGSFISWNAATAMNLARLGDTGSIDAGFNANLGSGLTSSVSALAIQGDKKILVGGSFYSLDGRARTGLARVGGDVSS